MPQCGFHFVPNSCAFCAPASLVFPLNYCDLFLHWILAGGPWHWPGQTHGSCLAGLGQVSPISTVPSWSSSMKFQLINLKSNNACNIKAFSFYSFSFIYFLLSFIIWIQLFLGNKLKSIRTWAFPGLFLWVTSGVWFCVCHWVSEHRTPRENSPKGISPECPPGAPDLQGIYWEHTVITSQAYESSRPWILRVKPCPAPDFSNFLSPLPGDWAVMPDFYLRLSAWKSPRLSTAIWEFATGCMSVSPKFMLKYLPGVTVSSNESLRVH